MDAWVAQGAAFANQGALPQALSSIQTALGMVAAAVSGAPVHMNARAETGWAVSDPRELQRTLQYPARAGPLVNEGSAHMQGWMLWTRMRSSTRLPSSSACSKRAHLSSPSSSNSSRRVLPHLLDTHLHPVAGVLQPCSGLVSGLM